MAPQRWTIGVCVFFKLILYKQIFNPILPGGGADLPPPRTNAYTPKNQWVEILIIFAYS